MKVYTFPRGGLNYTDNTAPQKNIAENAFLPSLSVIQLGRGKRKAYPVVSAGEMVREGMLVGKSSADAAVNVHATVPGKVIRSISWKDKDGIENDALLIRMEGTFEKLGRKEEVFPWAGLSGYDLQKIISDYSIVEMEPPGQPLSQIITAARKKNGSLTLVVRCIFDDPWLAADYVLCKNRLDAVIEGVSIVAKACLKVTHVIFAVSFPEKELGEDFLSKAANLEIPYSLVVTGSRYPQRNSRELELALRIYEKKQGLDLGSLIILGPSVLAAAYDAVVYKKPILDRYVAIGGSAIKHPQIIKARIGTRIGELIEQCGGFNGPPQKVVVGSPLSGREIMYLDEPVAETCYAVVAMSKSQAACPQQQNCINCGECRAVCPVGLDPQNIYKQIRAQLIDNISITGCQGCGCCRIVCPSSLPLLETFLEKRQEAAE